MMPPLPPPPPAPPPVEEPRRRRPRRRLSPIRRFAERNRHPIPWFAALIEADSLRDDSQARHAQEMLRRLGWAVQRISDADCIDHHEFDYGRVNASTERDRTDVCVHGPRVTAFRQRTRCGSTKAVPVAIGPDATPDGVPA